MAERRQRENTAGATAASSLLRRNRDFRRLFVASVISLGGDWFLFVALGGLVLQVTGEAISVGFLAIGPSDLWLAYVLLAVLSLFTAVFDPASSAAIPNVVDPADLPTAN